MPLSRGDLVILPRHVMWGIDSRSFPTSVDKVILFIDQERDDLCSRNLYLGQELDRKASCYDVSR